MNTKSARAALVEIVVAAVGRQDWKMTYKKISRSSNAGLI